LIGSQKRIRDPEFLRFAKEQGGICCVCRRTTGVSRQAEELHHFGEKGMGQKCHDYEIARVCRRCHGEIQGKRRMAFIRADRMDILEAMATDALELLIAYVQGIKTRRSDGKRKSIR